MRRNVKMSNYFEQRRAQLFAEDAIDTTIDTIKEWKPFSFTQVITNVDLDPQTRTQVAQLFFDLGFILPQDLAHAVYLCGLYSEWSTANLIVEHAHEMTPKPDGFGWRTLRKCIGNWDLFRDRKQLKELCIKIMKLDAKAMPQLNKWAMEYAKSMGRTVKGYCDLCAGDSQKFAMMYSTF